MPDVGVRGQEGVANDLIFWPNPGSEELLIRTERVNGGTFQLLDASGRMARSGLLTPPTTTVHTAELLSGVYALQVSHSDGHRTTAKWVKQ